MQSNDKNIMNIKVNKYHINKALAYVKEKFDKKNFSYDQYILFFKENNSLNEIMNVIIKLNDVNKYLEDDIISNLVFAYCTVNNIDINQILYNDFNNSYKDDSVTNYIHSMYNLPPVLSAEEEKKLLQLINLGDKNARRIFIERNLRLVVSIAKGYIGNGMDFEDLIEEGNIGLLKAIDKFDITTGYKFSTYAVFWIRQSISRSIYEQSRNIRIPIDTHNQIKKMNKIKKEYLNKYNRKATYQELAKLMNLSIRRIQELEMCANDTISLYTPIIEGEDDTLADLVYDENETTPAQKAERILFNENILKYLDKLSDKEKRVIELRFGLNDETNHTLEEVGKKFDLTRERIRQIEEKSLRKLKFYMKRNGFNAKD